MFEELDLPAREVKAYDAIRLRGPAGHCTYTVLAEPHFGDGRIWIRTRIAELSFEPEEVLEVFRETQRGEKL